jgi:Leucine-rich repeat (LRR) protein
MNACHTPFTFSIILRIPVCGFAMLMLTLTLLAFAAPPAAEAATYYYQSGNPNVPGNWDDAPLGGGTDALNFTTATDIFIVPANTTATLTAPLTLGAGVSLQVQANGTLNTQTFSIAGAGSFQLFAGATLATASLSGVNGGAITVLGTRTFIGGANYIFTGNGAQVTGFGGVPLITSVGFMTVTLATATSTLTMDNNVTFSSRVLVQRGTLDAGAVNLTFTGGANSVIFSPGTVFVKRSTLITAPAGTIVYQSGTVNARLQYVGAIFATAEFESTIAGDVRVDATSTILLQGNSTINGSLTVDGQIKVGGAGSFSLTVNGNFSVTNTASIIDINGGSLILNGAITIADGARFFDTFTANGSLTIGGTTGTITGRFVWTVAPNNLGSLTMNRPGAVLTLGADLPIASTLRLTRGFIASAPGTAFRLDLINSSSMVQLQGGSDSSFVQTILRRRFLPSQTNVPSTFFPVGRSGAYQPLTLSGITTGMGAPTIEVQALTGLMATFTTPVFSLGTDYWRVEGGTSTDYSRASFATTRTSPPSLSFVPSNSFTSSNSLAGPFTEILSTVVSSGMSSSVQSSPRTITSGSPRFFAIGNTTPIPRITGFTPTTGGTTTVATITGVNFGSTRDVLDVFFGSVRAQSFTVVSPTEIRAVVGGGETGFIRVVTIGGTTTASTTFAYAPLPAITAVRLTAGGAGSIISLRGRNLSSTASVTFGGFPVLIVLRSDTLVQVRIPNVDVSGAIRLGTPGGVALTTSTFTWVLPPVISRVTPTIGTIFDVITITGANLTLTTNVLVGGVEVFAFTINSPTQVSAVVRDGSTGTVVIQTPAGEATSATIFFYVESPTLTGAFSLPTATDTSRAITSAIAGTSILIRGQDLQFATQVNVGAVVITKADIQIRSSTEITVRLPQRAVTRATISVSTPGGAVIGTQLFEIEPFVAISGFSPPSGTGGTIVQIFGRGFTTDATVSIVGATASSISLVSTTEILAVVGVVPPRVTRGKLIVSTTNGTVTASADFLISPVQPIITAVEPQSATFGSLVTVRGQFLTSVREVTIGGGRAEIVRSVSPTELIIRITQQNTTGTIRLTTASGSTTSNFEVTIIPSPFILSITPGFTITNGTVTLRGGNFTGTETVLLASGSSSQSPSLLQTFTRVQSFQVLSDSVMTVRVGNQSGTFTIRTVGPRGTAQSTQTLQILGRLEFETAVLRELYDSLNGSAWTNRASNRWSSGDAVTEWAGVTVEGGRITQLRLADNNLSGQLPEVISELTALRVLDLTDNNIRGAFPDWIVRIPTLEEVRVGGNRFTGRVPDSVGNLVRLRVFVADRNQLSGTLPGSLCNCAALQELNVNQNALTGTLFPCIGNLSNLVTLNVGQNLLSGGLPLELNNLTQLRGLYLHRNAFTGSVPESFGMTVSTTSSTASVETPRLRALWLNGNRLVGEPPASLASLTQLEELLLDNNQFTGESLLQRTVPLLTNLRVLDLGRNTFTGTLPATIANLKRLRYLSVRSNRLTGTIPAEFATLDTLQTLYLDSNTFTGSLPASFAMLRNIQTLGFSYNRLTSIPRLNVISLTAVAAQGNALQFGDLETNSAIENFQYAPQDSLGVARDTAVVIGNPLTLAVAVSGQNNQYQWFRDSVEVQATSSTIAYRLDSFSPQDTGRYTVVVTNRFIDGLRLVSRPIRVRPLAPKPPSQAPDLLFPQSGATYIAFSPTVQWTRVDNGVEYEVQVSESRDFFTITTGATLRSADTTITALAAQVSGLEGFTLYYWRVRTLNGIGVASPWSQVSNFVTAPPNAAIVMSSVNFGNVVLGESTSGFAFLTNLINEDLNILDIVTDDDEGSFRVPLDVRGLVLKAGQTVSLRNIVFTPRNVGAKAGRVTIVYFNPVTMQRDSIRLDRVLLGRGTPIKLLPVVFDTIRTGGRTAQTTAVIINRGGVGTRVLVKTLRLTGNDNGFQVVTAASETLVDNIPINGGDTTAVIMRCTPKNVGNLTNTLRVTAEFTITSTTAGIVTFQDTLFTSVSAFARDTLPDDIPVRLGVRPSRDSVAPGGRLNMELYLVEGSLDTLIALAQRERSALVATLRVNPQVLSLDDGQRQWRIRNTDPRNRLLRIGIPYTLADTNYAQSWVQGLGASVDTVGLIQFRRDSVLSQFLRDSVLVRFSYSSVAGDVATTGIVLESVRFGVDTLGNFTGARRIFVEGLLPGTFTVRTSRAGGERRITTVQRPRLALLAGVQPNPVQNVGEVHFTLFAEMPVELILTDVLGRVMKRLDAGEHAAGEYVARAPFNDLPQGTYFLVLRTPLAILTERVEVRR